MAIAMRGTSKFGKQTAMRTIKIAALAFLATLAATAANAQAWQNSAGYNGYGAMNQNTASNFSLRDQNGNMTIVDGQFTSANFGTNQGSQSASAGVGTSGAGAAYGQAMAIGNQLQVQVIGFNNTVIVDSNQINTGNQTAVVDLNKH
jgi:holdfast attachment protein HfaA